MKSHEIPADNDMIAALGAREWPGYRGCFSRAQAPGAFPNGTRIVKVWREQSDMEKIGARGTVLGSIAIPKSINCPPTCSPLRMSNAAIGSNGTTCPSAPCS